MDRSSEVAGPQETVRLGFADDIDEPRPWTVEGLQRDGAVCLDRLAPPFLVVEAVGSLETSVAVVGFERERRPASTPERLVTSPPLVCVSRAGPTRPSSIAHRPRRNMSLAPLRPGGCRRRSRK